MNETKILNLTNVDDSVTLDTYYKMLIGYVSALLDTNTISIMTFNELYYYIGLQASTSKLIKIREIND